MRFIAYSCIVLLCFSCNNKKDTGDCGRFKNGEYYMPARNLGTTYRFIRNDSIQQEIDLTNNSIQTFRIEWINDCEYYLHFISRTPADSFVNEKQRKLRLHFRSLPSRMRIVNAGINHHQVMAYKKGYDELLSDTIWNADTYKGVGGFRPIGH